MMGFLDHDTLLDNILSFNNFFIYPKNIGHFYVVRMFIEVIQFSCKCNLPLKYHLLLGAQWLSGRVLNSRPKSRRFEPHLRHCVVSLSKNINPSLVLVQPRKTCSLITERLLMGRKESNQTNHLLFLHFLFNFSCLKKQNKACRRLLII